MWAVMVLNKGLYECHEIVATEACARRLAELLEGDGSDVYVCSIDKDMIVGAAEFLRK